MLSIIQPCVPPPPHADVNASLTRADRAYLPEQLEDKLHPVCGRTCLKGICSIHEVEWTHGYKYSRNQNTAYKTGLGECNRLLGNETKITSLKVNVLLQLLRFGLIYEKTLDFICFVCVNLWKYVL